MIELELWRARIGLYHAASACRRSRRLKNSSQSLRLSTTTKWGSKEAVDDIPFALRSCIAGVSLLLVVQCILTFLKKQHIRKALSSFVEGSYRVVKAVLTSGVPLLLKVCVVVIPLLLLLAGDVERNPGPTEGTTVAAEHVNELAAVLNKVAASWDLFVGQLGLAHHVVEQIQYDNAGKPELSKRCLLSGLQRWVESTDTPTYEKIVAALRSDTIGRKPLADDVQKFAERMKAGDVERNPGPTEGSTVCEEHMRLLTILLDELAGVWELFVIQLGLQSHEVNRIKRDHANYSGPELSRRCLTAGLHCWMNSTDDPTYEEIAAVLRGKVVTNCTLADDVEFLAKTLKGKKGSKICQESKTVTIEEAQTDCHVKVSSLAKILVCGCQKCPLFKTDRCPAPTPITFPKMSEIGLTEDKMAELAAETIKIDRNFNDLVSDTLKSFEERNVPQKKLLRSLMALNCFAPKFKGEPRPLVYQLKKELREAEGISDMMDMMSSYYSFFDFHIIERVIQYCGNDDDKGMLQSYKDDLKDYLARRIYKMPSKLAHYCEDHAKIVVKLDSLYEDYDAVHLKVFEKNLADIFHVSEGVLRLCDIVSGCFELTFQVPSFVAEAIFPLSEAQETELAANHVLRLSCGDYHWPRQDCQSDDDSPKPPDDDDEGSLAVQFEQVEVVSKGDPPPDEPDDGDSALGTSLHTSDKSKTITSKSETATAHQGVDDALTQLRNLKERDEADAKRKDKPLLHFLAQTGNLNAMKKLITSDNANPEIVDNYGNMPIHQATYGGHIKILKYLIEELSCQPTSPGNLRRTPLHLAAMYGHLDIVKYLVDEQALDPLTVDVYSSTPLHYSAYHGYVDVTIFLAEEITKFKSVKIDHLGSNVRLFSPFHFAVMLDHLDIVKYFVIKHRCDPMCPDIRGDLPLHLAAGKGSLKVLKYFIRELKLDPMTSNVGGFPLDPMWDIHVYGRKPLHNAAQGGQLKTVKWLIEHCKCKPSEGDDSGYTALHCSAAGGSLNVLKYLIFKRKCDPMCRSKDKLTPLHIAALLNQKPVVEYLTLQLHCNPNVQDSLCRTPLLLAAQNGHKQIIEFLVFTLKCDANAMHRDSRTGTALHIAADNGQLDVVTYLIERCDCNPSIRDRSGGTPLHDSASGDHVPVMKYLITQHNCNPMESNSQGCTPLHKAAENGQINALKYLILDLHCDQNAKDNYGTTPLHDAARKGFIHVVQFLVSKLKCDPNSSNGSNITTLHFAAMNGHFNVVKYLIEDLKCRTHVIDQLGFSPLHYAVHNGHLDIVRFYIEDLVIPADIRGEEYSFLMQVASEFQQHHIVEYLQQKQHMHTDVGQQ